ncbi:MAG: S8 family serine peptidase, partial [Thermoleophilaceae bacterium]|nr:S8 family serine peptidase [Thermoleophilaceae bacterium]
PYSQGLEDAIRRAGDAGIVMAVAAGNEGVDNDLEPSYPASYSLSNMVTVAATNSRNRLANFSNRGRDSVQIAAPGVNIISIAGSGYEAWSGTSMATPHVTGIAALLKAHKPDASAAEIVNAIVDGAKPVSALRSTIKSGGVANAMRSLVAIDSPDADLNAPDLVAPSSFLLRSPGRKIRVNRNGSVSFRWTQTHDADNDLLGYEIRVDGKRRGFVADPDIDGPRVAATTKRVKVKPGSHRWSVVAIDEAGNKRSASAPGGHGSFARISVVAH